MEQLNISTKQTKGKHLTYMDRVFLETCLKQKRAVAWIASALNTHRSTVYREIKAGTVPRLNSDLTETTVDKGYIRNVSNGTLKEKTSRRKWGKGKKRALKVAHKPKKSIRERSAEANDRTGAGNFEGDLIVSGMGTSGAALLTLVDRRSRFAYIEVVKDKTQKSVIEAFNRLERRLGSVRLREIMKTLTLDNGSEFLDWESLEVSAVAKTIKRFTVYFADPFSSWQRGSNENFNRMVRKFIPKGADISKYTKKEIRQIEEWINNYPRRILNYLSAKEVFEGGLECCQV